MTPSQKDLAVRLLESALKAVKADEGFDPQTILTTALRADGIKASLTIRFENIVH